MCPALAESQVQRRQDEEVEQGRGDEASQNHHGHGVLDLVSRDRTGDNQWHQSRAVAKAVIIIGANRSA